MKDTTVKISVLIPVYNTEQHLRRCLDSVLAQSLHDIEVVAVNDASPDGSLAILREYAERDPRVKIIDKPANEGLMMARATGILNARGLYLSFLDSDDYIAPGSLQALYDAATASDADITVGEMRLENHAGCHVLRPRAHVAGPDGEAYLHAILNWTTCSLCGALYHRRLFDGHDYERMMHQGFSEDRILLTQILVARRPKVMTVAVPTYYYCLNDQSITHVRMSEDDLRNQLKALMWCYDYVERFAPRMAMSNRNFIIRYLSLYLEKGRYPKIVAEYNDTARRLLRFGEMRRATSTRFALHTLLCRHLPPYSAACHTARRIIRKLQGKE